MNLDRDTVEVRCVYVYSSASVYTKFYAYGKLLQVRVFEVMSCKCLWCVFLTVESVSIFLLKN